MDAGERQSPRFQALQSLCLLGGSKGCVRRPRFLRPFAPCFASVEDGQPVYLLNQWLLQSVPRAFSMHFRSILHRVYPHLSTVIGASGNRYVETVEALLSYLSRVPGGACAQGGGNLG